MASPRSTRTEWQQYKAHRISGVEEQLFGLVDLHSQEGRTLVVRVVIQHDGPMLGFYDTGVAPLRHPQNKLGLSSIHFRVEASWVHSEWVQILFLTDISITADESLHGYMIEQYGYLSQ